MGKPQTHHHTPEEIAQAMEYQNEGKTTKPAADNDHVDGDNFCVGNSGI